MKRYLLLSFTITVLLISSVSALEIGENVEFEPSGSSTLYIMNTTLDLGDGTFEINETAIFFNDSIFQVAPSTGSITVYINRWNPPTIINYDVVCASGTVTHRMGGFTAGGSYPVYVDSGLPYATVTANSTGVVNFTYSSWSRHRFQIGSGPLAGFTYLPTNPIVDTIISFNDTSSDVDGTVVAWSWNFGDGTTSSQHSPTHPYKNEGTHTVTLTVTDNDSYQDTEIQYITVGGSGPSPPPETYDLTVVTIDTRYSPLSGVEVYAYWDGVLVGFAYTVDGSVAFTDLEEGTYMVRTSKPGYQDATTAVYLDRDKSISIMMEKWKEVIPGFGVPLLAVAMALYLFWQRKLGEV